MEYSQISEGIFLNRPNRFLAHVTVNGQEVISHVKNTGRCHELLIPGTKVLLQHHDNPKRKTAYSLIGVYKGERLINMDSQAPNQVVYEWLCSGGDGRFPNIKNIKREVVYGNSRFDLYFEWNTEGEMNHKSLLPHRVFMEVKGVTLEEDGVALFPDAPTERGVKHIKELEKSIDDSYEPYILFLIQMKGVDFFTPNRQRHEDFADTLMTAFHKGVTVLAYDCEVTVTTLNLSKQVKIVWEST